MLSRNVPRSEILATLLIIKMSSELVAYKSVDKLTPAQRRRRADLIRTGIRLINIG